MQEKNTSSVAVSVKKPSPRVKLFGGYSDGRASLQRLNQLTLGWIFSTNTRTHDGFVKPCTYNSFIPCTSTVICNMSRKCTHLTEVVVRRFRRFLLTKMWQKLALPIYINKLDNYVKTRHLTEIVIYSNLLNIVWSI